MTDIDKYFLDLIEKELDEIERLKKSVEPEKILWSTEMSADDHLAHAIYSRIYSLAKRYLPGTPRQRGIAEPDPKLDSPMRVYTAWDALCNGLPVSKDFEELTQPVYKGRLAGSELSFLNFQLGYVRYELSIIVKMLQNAFD